MALLSRVESAKHGVAPLSAHLFPIPRSARNQVEHVVVVHCKPRVCNIKEKALRYSSYKNTDSSAQSSRRWGKRTAQGGDFSQKVISRFFACKKSAFLLDPAPDADNYQFCKNIWILDGISANMEQEILRHSKSVN